MRCRGEQLRRRRLARGDSSRQAYDCTQVSNGVVSAGMITADCARHSPSMSGSKDNAEGKVRTGGG